MRAETGRSPVRAAREYLLRLSGGVAEDHELVVGEVRARYQAVDHRHFGLQRRAHDRVLVVGWGFEGAVGQN